MSHYFTRDKTMTGVVARCADGTMVDVYVGGRLAATGVPITGGQIPAPTLVPHLGLKAAVGDAVEARSGRRTILRGEVSGIRWSGANQWERNYHLLIRWRQ